MGTTRAGAVGARMRHAERRGGATGRRLHARSGQVSARGSGGRPTIWCNDGASSRSICARRRASCCCCCPASVARERIGVRRTAPFLRGWPLSRCTHFHRGGRMRRQRTRLCCSVAERIPTTPTRRHRTCCGHPPCEPRSLALRVVFRPAVAAHPTPSGWRSSCRALVHPLRIVSCGAVLLGCMSPDGFRRVSRARVRPASGTAPTAGGNAHGHQAFTALRLLRLRRDMWTTAAGPCWHEGWHFSAKSSSIKKTRCRFKKQM